MRPILLALTALTAGCIDFDGQSCTTIYAYYDVTMTRTLDVAAANVDRAGIRACIDEQCADVPVPGTDGHAKFGGFGPPPNGELTLSTATDGRQIVSAKFGVGERAGSARLRVIVRDSGGTAHTAEGTVQFNGATCHPAPRKTDV